MHCPNCGFANPEGMNFCGKCASPLSLGCPQCGFANPPGFAFCGKCATSLQTLDARPIDPRLTAGERRQLTVMFCAVVGSTPLSQQLDPEELRTVMLAYQEACAQVIRRFEGYLARYVGDGLLVYFGYPQAHEDDAQRAVRAGLGIVAALPQLNDQLQYTVGAIHELPLRVRIGIHTGLVVVGNMDGGGFRDPMAIVGETPNIAARVQGIAAPDTVVISEATHRLVQELFTCRALGPQELKGVSTPIPVYQVLEESSVQSCFEVAVTAGLTLLVGREEELGLLRRHWEQAKEGQGQVVLLSGEAGIGKSRLVQELKEQVVREGCIQIEFRCSPYYKNTAFYPVIDHLQRLLQFRRDDSPQEKLAKLERMLQGYRLPQQDVVPLFAALLSLPHPDSYPPLTRVACVVRCARSGRSRRNTWSRGTSMRSMRKNARAAENVWDTAQPLARWYNTRSELMKLQGKVAPITGTSPNICGGIAEGMAEEGAKIVCVDIQPDNANLCADYITKRGGQTIGVVCDVTNEDQRRSPDAAQRNLWMRDRDARQRGAERSLPPFERSSN